MKKFVAGIIVGVFLFAGASAFADSSSLIGQKVQGLFSVEKAGTKVADAIVINGTAYAPVRAISEATGIELAVEGKRIIIQEQLVDGLSISDQIRATKILEVKMAIEKLMNAIEKTHSDLLAEKAKLVLAQTDEEKENISNAIQQLEGELEIMNNLLTLAKADLAELLK